MKDLKRILLSALLLCVMAVGALAGDVQKDQKREPPPKDPKVIEKRDKEPNREQPRNDNQSREKPKEDRRKPPTF